MFEGLKRTYLALFREYPFLLGAAVVTGAGQIAFALLNICALPKYLVQGLGVSGVALGAASATFLLSETVLKFPMGRLSDRVGRRPLVVLGPLLICLNPVIVVSLPARLWGLIFPLRAADGVGAAALWPPLFAMVGDVVRDRSRAAAMSVMNTVYVGAIGLAAVVGAFVAHVSGGARPLFYLASGLLVASAATAHLGLPRQARAASLREARAEAPEAAAGAEPWGSRTCPMALVCAISLLMSMGVLMLANFLMLYLEMDLRLSDLEIGVLVSALAGPVLALGLPLGHAADRWGTARAVRVSLAVSALAMWVIPSCRTMVAFGAVAAVLITSHILGTPAWLALVSQLAPRSRRGGVMGIVATAEGVGAVVGPLLGGWLWDMQARGPHHSYIFYGSAAFLTVAALIAAVALRGDWLRPRAGGGQAPAGSS